MNESAGAARGTWAGVATGYGFGLVLLPIVTLGATPGSVERGFREAISEMLRWLTTDYGLTQQEAHTLLGLAAELRVASWFATSACEVPKKYLPPRPDPTAQR